MNRSERLWCMEPRWCDRPFPGWLADPDCVWFRRTYRAIECVDLHGDFGLLGLECASGELAAVEPLDASHRKTLSIGIQCWVRLTIDRRHRIHHLKSSSRDPDRVFDLRDATQAELCSRGSGAGTAMRACYGVVRRTG